MKTAPKSNLLDYEKLYTTLLGILSFSLLYVCINFFLPASNFLSFFFLALASFYFICFLFSRNKLHLILSISSAVLSIILSLVFIYLVH